MAPPLFVGVDTMDYQVCDIILGGSCSPGRIIIKVSNARPVATDDTASVNKNMQYSSYVSVLANDSTTDGDVFSIVAVTNGTTANGGSYTLDNAGNYTYSPASDFVGEDYFTYIIEDRCDDDTAFVRIQVEDIFIPEGFSPNGDGSHDFFVIEGGEGYKIDIKVFNRWGSMVYQMDDYKSPDWWDGSANSGITLGDRLPDGTYYYVIDLNDGKKPRVRYITIKR
jgi:gliding motility-associated-like protein